MHHDEESRDAIIEMLLAAGAKITITDDRWKVARDKLLRVSSKKEAAPALALFKQADDSRRAEMLVRARRRWMASHGSRPMDASVRERTRGGQRALLSLRVELTPLP